MYRNIYFIGPIYTEFIQNELDASNYMSCIGGNIGNVSIMIANEKIIKVYCISRISNDSFGANIRSILKEHDVHTKYIQEDQTHISSIIFIDLYKNKLFQTENFCYENCIIPNFIENNKTVLLYFTIDTLINKTIIDGIIDACIADNIISIFNLNGEYKEEYQFLIKSFLIHNINICIGTRKEIEQLFKNSLENIIKKKNTLFKKLFFIIIKDYNGYKYTSSELDILIPVHYEGTNWENSVFTAAMLNFFIKNNTTKEFNNPNYVYQMFDYCNINTANHNSKYLQK